VRARVVMPEGGDLTKQEQTNVRTALRFLRGRFGTWAPLAKALNVNDTTVSSIANGHKTASASIAYRIARFARVGVDDVLTGRFPAEGACPMCGHAPKLDDTLADRGGA
jgi:DNA-binding XRE family transcriptional regulator